jgi:hypothetical protein
MELKNNFNKKKKTLIKRWNWKQKKPKKKGQGKTLKKIKTEMKNKTFEKL